MNSEVMNELPDYCLVHTAQTQPRAGDGDGMTKWPSEVNDAADRWLAERSEMIEVVNSIAAQL